MTVRDYAVKKKIEKCRHYKNKTGKKEELFGFNFNNKKKHS